MELEPDANVVRRLKAGEEAAFDQIYDAYRPKLFAFLLRLSRRHDVAEDLLEEAWLRLVTRVGSLRDDTRLAPWLFAVARNLFLSYRRWRLLDEDRVGEFCRLPAMRAPDGTPFEHAATNELREQVERALGMLPVPYREALLLVAIEGFTPAEAAAVCGLAPDVLRKRLSRARAMLSRILVTSGRDSIAVTRPRG
jgi:RNA polymerase sigma-70 factor, ECF subfamily